MNKNDLKNKNILRLTLNKKAFEITGTEEKPFELRKYSYWIKSRICNYYFDEFYYFHYVLFVNGYGKRPFKLFKFESIEKIKENKTHEFSNGLTFEVFPGDYKILLGELVASGDDVTELFPASGKNKKYRLFRKVRNEDFLLNKKEKQISHPDSDKLVSSQACLRLNKEYGYTLQVSIV